MKITKPLGIINIHRIGLKEGQSCWFTPDYLGICSDTPCFGFFPHTTLLTLAAKKLCFCTAMLHSEWISLQPDSVLALNHHHRAAIPEDISVEHISTSPVARGDDTPVLNLQLTSEAFNLLFLPFFQNTAGFPGRKVIKIVS